MKIQRKITVDENCLVFELEQCTKNPLYQHCFVCGCFNSKYHWQLDYALFDTNTTEILEMSYELPEYDAFDSVYRNVMPFTEKHLET